KAREIVLVDLVCLNRRDAVAAWLQLTLGKIRQRVPGMVLVLSDHEDDVRASLDADRRHSNADENRGDKQQAFQHEFTNSPIHQFTNSPTSVVHPKALDKKNQ